MESWAQRGLLSDEGKDWLVAALDPFHDSQLQHLAGYPDVETSASVVRLVKQSTTVSVDPSITGNWDCLVVQWPWMEQHPFNMTTARSNNQISTSTGIQPLGGLQVFQIPSGTVGGFDLSNPLVISSNAIVLSNLVQQGSTRMIGAGFEIHNTTAEIAKQGAICNFMMHNVPRDASLFTAEIPVGGTNVITNAFNGTCFRAPPRTTQEALLIPGSNEWAAKDGVYATCRFQGVDNPPYTVDYNLPVLFDTDDFPGPPGTNTSSFFYPAEAMSVGTSACPGFKCFPIHTSGCILTGLSNTTSFRLNSNVFIEAFPGPRQQLDLSIATPSAAFDPRALEIYSHTLGHAPVAVPVGENPLGEWFMDMVGKVGNFLSNVPGPVGIVAKGAQAVAETFKPFMTSPSGTNQNNSKQARAPNPKRQALPAPRPTKPVRTITQGEWNAMTPQARSSFHDFYKLNIVPGKGPVKKKKKKGGGWTN